MTWCRELLVWMLQPGVADDGVAHHAGDVAGDVEGELGGAAAAADPQIQVAGAPIVGGERVWPIAVAQEHLRQISPAEPPVLEEVEAVAAADIESGGGADLHRALGPSELRPPHAGVGAMPRFDAVDGEGDAVEFAAAGRA